MTLPEGECPNCLERVFKTSYLSRASAVELPVLLDTEQVEIFVVGRDGRVIRGTGYQRHALTCEEAAPRDVSGAPTSEEAADDAERDSA